MNACFFDLDGTLIDSKADLCATVNHTRRDFGLSELDCDKILACVGLGAKHLLANSIPEVPNVDESWAVFKSHYGEHMLESVTLYPGVRETLDELKRLGWLLGVNTAKPAFATKAILEHFGLDDFFGAAVIAGGDCDEMKPSPKPLFACAEKMNHIVTPNDWMVGDSWTDIRCGVAAGVKTAFCQFGFGVLYPEDKCDASLTSFPELLSAVFTR
jgi:phosphoglycolate phosphatase